MNNIYADSLPSPLKTQRKEKKKNIAKKHLNETCTCFTFYILLLLFHS